RRSTALRSAGRSVASAQRRPPRRRAHPPAATPAQTAAQRPASGCTPPRLRGSRRAGSPSLRKTRDWRRPFNNRGGLPHLPVLWWHPIIVNWFAAYARSSIGAKHIMAVTGLLLFLFAIVHMLGHLQMFGGRDMYNAYAHFLQELWEVKWPVRAGLVALLAIHVATAIALVAKNRAARPVGYAVYRPVVSSAA